MLRLTRLEIHGFGPFAEPQTIDFPREAGVVVVYGENMRGKTTLLNAIRYAFFGYALGRGSRERTLHSLTNRERAAMGEYGFSVSLAFDFDRESYELLRTCSPQVEKPETDGDYAQDVMLRCGGSVLGPQERDAALTRIFPKEISRFFLFDGELLQEYEELIITESEVGPAISAAIERILGVPILKSARSHLAELAQEADQEAAREASRHSETTGLGIALNTAIDQRAAHLAEQKRKQEELNRLTRRRTELEAQMAADRRYAEILERRDNAERQAEAARKRKERLAAEIRGAMAQAWRTLLKDPIRRARAAAQEALEAELRQLRSDLRRNALDSGECEICLQPVGSDAQALIRAAQEADAAPARPRRKHSKPNSGSSAPTCAGALSTPANARYASSRWARTHEPSSEPRRRPTPRPPRPRGSTPATSRASARPTIPARYASSSGSMAKRP